MDVSASFQFLVDALRQNWQVIAPDWRGFGLSELNQGTYWFQDYLADLDALINSYSPNAFMLKAMTGIRPLPSALFTRH